MAYLHSLSRKLVSAHLIKAYDADFHSRITKNICVNAAVSRLDAIAIRNTGFPTGLEMENDHAIEIQIVKAFVKTCLTGVLPSKRLTATAAIDYIKFHFAWNGQVMASLPPIGNRLPETMNDRFYEIIGSDVNTDPFYYLPSSMNNAKGKLFKLERVLKTNLPEWVEAVGVGTKAEKKTAKESLMESIREVSIEQVLISYYARL